MTLFYNLGALLLGGASASHLRAGGLSIFKDLQGNWVVDHTQAWRHASSYYANGGCQPSDVTNTVVSQNYGNTMQCTTCVGTTSYPLTYQVTDVFLEGDPSQQYCYGSKQFQLNAHDGSAEIKVNFGSGAWVPLVDDTGATQGGASWVFSAFNKIAGDNASPVIKVPPSWRVIPGCISSLNLAPSDAEGDTIKCRLALKSNPDYGNVDECGDICHGNAYDWGSLSVSEDCVVTYDGTLDRNQAAWVAAGETGIVKPIAIMVEDFDAGGVVKSSMPIQFLVTVWWPQALNGGNRITATCTNNQYWDDNNPLCSSAWEWGARLHDDSHDEAFAPGGAEDPSPAGRKKRSLEDVPMSVNMRSEEVRESVFRVRRDVNPNCPVPPAVSEPGADPNGVQEEYTLGNDGESVTFTLTATASTPGAVIDFYEFTSPLGMVCDNQQNAGAGATIDCEYNPPVEHHGTTQQFCYSAVDTAGINSPRYCTTITVIDGVTPPNQGGGGGGAPASTFPEGTHCYECAVAGLNEADVMAKCKAQALANADLTNGYRECVGEADTCFLEVRSIGGLTKQLSTGCKQSHACEKNQSQNFGSDKVRARNTNCKPETNDVNAAGRRFRIQFQNYSVCNQCMPRCNIDGDEDRYCFNPDFGMSKSTGKTTADFHKLVEGKDQTTDLREFWKHGNPSFAG